ncbi:MAG: ABC transporter ATP-binding protein [Actinomycetia bacterium]|nr:ABC transporter ATP-binding protein [Actinomycetes bacterium]
MAYPSVDGDVVALAGVDFTCHYGTSTAIVGRSGSGKSTLISVLSMLRTPTSGSVMIDGVETTTLSAIERDRLRALRIGIVFQAFHLEPTLSVLDNVTLPWRFTGARQSAREARAHADEVLGQLDIADLAHRHPNTLSGGQRQRVAIARALFARPALFVADEPTGNLDEDTANDIADVLLELPARFGTAVVIVTHDRAVAARADRTLTITRGQIR